jgi:lipopolysaccharide transport system permease protein
MPTAEVGKRTRRTGLRAFWDSRSLILHMVRREVAGRYRGSALGMLWALLTPLLMLAVYTFVFGTVFRTRWVETSATAPDFAILLFTGLILFQLFSEVVNRAPRLIIDNVNYVKKVVFPLEILPVVALGVALFHGAVSLIVLFAFILAFTGSLAPTALLLPIVWLPFLLFTLGLAWLLASLGVYFRDISQLLNTIVTALLFLSPIFYPSTALPEWLRPYLFLNPLTLPIEQTRDVLIWGRAPDAAAFMRYAVVTIIVAWLGYVWFQGTRKGFADVL